MAKPQKPNVAYKDAPEDVKRQLEMKDGLKPSQALPNLADAGQDSHAQAINFLQGQAATAEPIPEESPIPNADPDVRQAVEEMQATHIAG